MTDLLELVLDDVESRSHGERRQDYDTDTDDDEDDEDAPSRVDHMASASMVPGDREDGPRRVHPPPPRPRPPPADTNDLAEDGPTDQRWLASAAAATRAARSSGGRGRGGRGRGSSPFLLSRQPLSSSSSSSSLASPVQWYCGRLVLLSPLPYCTSAATTLLC